MIPVQSIAINGNSRRLHITHWLDNLTVSTLAMHSRTIRALWPVIVDDKIKTRKHIDISIDFMNLFDIVLLNNSRLLALVWSCMVISCSCWIFFGTITCSTNGLYLLSVNTYQLIVDRIFYRMFQMLRLYSSLCLTAWSRLSNLANVLMYTYCDTQQIRAFLRFIERSIVDWALTCNHTNPLFHLSNSLCSFLTPVFCRGVRESETHTWKNFIVLVSSM